MHSLQRIGKKALCLCAAAAITTLSVPNADTGSAANHARVSVHDPSVIKLSDGSYFIIGSHLAAARSADLGSWTSAANSHLGSKNTTFFNDIYTDLAVPAAWSSPSNANYDLSGNLWAPDIIWNEAMGKYCMYLSINGDNWKSSIVMCTADNIEGPYTYVDTVVYSGFNNTDTFHYSKTDVERVLGSNPDISRYLSNGEWNANYGTNAIDPAVFYDETGALWMVYGSWFGGLFMLELDENTGLRDYNVTYPTITDASDAYMGTKVAGGHWVSGEGPYIEYMEDPDTGVGYYYLFVSYGCFNNDGGYNMRIFRSKNPNGPYTDQNGNSAIYTTGGDNIGGTVGQRLMSNYQWNCNDKPNKAQGHNSVLMDDDGKLFVIYHNKFDDNYGGHEVRVHQLIMNEDGWVVAAPYEYMPGEEVSAVGHTMDAVTGDYEFIFHKLNQTIVADQSTNGANAEVQYSQNITLNADGTVTGDISGVWTMHGNSADMTLTYGGVTYKGSFLVQADESAAMVQKMTFTATGNNTCIWGSKTDAYDAAVDAVDLTNADSKLIYHDGCYTNEGGALKIADTDLLSDIPYFITCKFNGLSLDLADGDTSEGANIQQWALTGGSHQEWRLVDLGNGYCKILSMRDETMAIAVDGTDDADGQNICIQKYSGAENQQWKLIRNGAFYGIVSRSSADASGLDVYDWSEENGGNINQWSYWGGDCQLWKITPVYPTVPDASYQLRNVNSGLYAGANGSNIEQTSEAVSWTLRANSDGTYAICDGNGQAMTVEQADPADGTNIFLSAETGAEAQKFILRPCKDGSYAILSACSGGSSGLDVYGISAEAGANICQWNFWGGDGQKWVLLSDEPAASAAYLLGDVNDDGAVNAMDYALAKQYSMNGFPDTRTLLAADLDGSGSVDKEDCSAFLDFLLRRTDRLH